MARGVGAPDAEAQKALAAAESAYQAGRFAEAREAYGRLLALHPELAPRIHQQIGFAYIQEKQYPRAVEQLKKAIEAEPMQPP